MKNKTTKTNSSKVEVSEKVAKKLKYLDVIEQYAADILEHPRFLSQKNFYQHGSISTYEHVLLVANKSISIARRLPFKVKEDSLVRAALLHDYYLYDWHHPGKEHILHPFKHGGWAKKNAVKDFNASKREQNAIKHHMFPLTIVPPCHLEGWIITVADKSSAIKESTTRKKKTKKQN